LRFFTCVVSATFLAVIRREAGACQTKRCTRVGKAGDLEIDGDSAGEARVAMQASDGPSEAPKGGSVSVVDGVGAVHVTLRLDGLHHLSICRDLVVQHRPIAVSLHHHPVLSIPNSLCFLLSARRSLSPHDPLTMTFWSAFLVWGPSWLGLHTILAIYTKIPCTYIRSRRLPIRVQ